MTRSWRDRSACRFSSQGIAAKTRGSSIKAIAALAIISAGAAIAGCGSGPAARPFNQSSAQAFASSIADRMVPVSRSGNLLRYRAIEYSTAVVNAGTPGAFTAFITVSRTVTVYSSSAASVGTAEEHPPTFTTPSDRERWVAAGSPALVPAGSSKTLSLAPGQFSFVLQGTPLTYRQASDLPGTPSAFSAQILDHLPHFKGTHPPATLVLKQLGYLIAVAPLPVAARSAAWHVAASLPGLYLCGTGTDLSGRRGEGLCVDAEGEETEILVNKRTGSVLAIEERLQRPSPIYPTVSGGSLIQSITFIGS